MSKKKNYYSNLNKRNSIPIDHLQTILQKVIKDYEGRPAEEFRAYMEGINTGLAMKVEYGKKDMPEYHELINLDKYTDYYFSSKDKAKLFVNRINDVASTFGKITIRDADKVYAYINGQTYEPNASEKENYILDNYGWSGYDFKPTINAKCIATFPVPKNLNHMLKGY